MKRLGWSRAEDIRNAPILSRQGSKKENVGVRKIVHILMAYEFAPILTAQQNGEFLDFLNHHKQSCAKKGINISLTV